MEGLARVSATRPEFAGKFLDLKGLNLVERELSVRRSDRGVRLTT